MAMNDISVSISADKESFLAFKDSSLADSADESGTEFFTQLQDAHTTFEPTKKEINKPETDTLSAASADSSSVTNEKLNSDSDDEDIAQINLSGSDILEQINSSQLMNTEVTKPSEKAKDINLADTSTNKTQLVIADLKEKLPVKGYVAVPAKDLPVKDEVGKIIRPHATLTDNNESGVASIVNDVDINDSSNSQRQNKTSLAQAVEAELNIKSDKVKHPAQAQSITQGFDTKDNGADTKKGIFTDKITASQSSVLSDVSVNSDQTILKTDVDKIVTTQSTLENSGKVNANTLAQNTIAKNTVAEQAENTLTATSPNSNITETEKADAINTLIAKDENALMLPNSNITETEKADAINALIAKDVNAFKTDKVLASLTPEQLTKLQTEIKPVMLDAPSKAEKLTVLKQMLTQFITDNKQPQSTDVKSSASEQFNTLSGTEKQALLTQLNAFIKAEQPKGEQLAAIKQAIGELKVLVAKDANQSSDTKFTISQKAVNDSQKLPQTNESQIDKVVTLPVKGEEITKPVTFVASQTPNTVNRPQKVSVKSGSENSADPTKLAAQPTSDEELTKALEQLQKEGLKNTTAEQSPAKVMQVFNHITNALNTTQTSAQSYYDSVDYEMGLLDQQAIQNQQLQSTAQTKQVSIDPGVMQAINIVKSDAAKLLQERVSSMLSINNKEAEIRLDPPEMGSMQIRVRSDAEQAQINFVVQNQQAKEALEQSMPRLREMLAQQGLELGESTISYGQSGGENADQNESGAGEQLAKNGAANSESDEPSNSPEQTSEQQTSSSIDYYA
ncbi:flagellar hook-length control protein FliK [Pseudoalteromonas sp. 2CM32C]|uniref:flagellar hook-length control protein FliK n=1 Tax=Pseudoalteromonas sp. 2CM32C TaxID=2929852 RepID=UPI0020BE5533|nr:flagellar hook-length control protein FliK [Pseudoalteromonas sp. 2CM32C]MCK8119925.1 flagellar hook-length control protein FliK [Pseudoalteromonas sp. 2CM32C]